MSSIAFVILINESYITNTEACEMLHKIFTEHVVKVVHQVLDNARYQKCSAAMDLAAQLDIEFDYVPTYSPNLDLYCTSRIFAVL